MTTSQTSFLAEPAGDNKVSQRVLGYVSEMARSDLYNLILTAFEDSKLPKNTIAKRLGKDPAWLTRVLGAPGNWTIDTVAELLFAIDGSVLDVDKCWPEREIVSNMSPNDFLTEHMGNSTVMQFRPNRTTTSSGPSTVVIEAKR